MLSTYFQLCCSRSPSKLHGWPCCTLLATSKSIYWFIDECQSHQVLDSIIIQRLKASPLFNHRDTLRLEKDALFSYSRPVQGCIFYIASKGFEPWPTFCWLELQNQVIFFRHLFKRRKPSCKSTRRRKLLAYIVQVPRIKYELKTWGFFLRRRSNLDSI